MQQELLPSGFNIDDRDTAQPSAIREFLLGQPFPANLADARTR